MSPARLAVTDLELRVLTLMAHGHCFKQIGALLGKSRKSVSRALRRVLARSGTSNYMQLGMLIERTQLLPIDERNRIEDRREVRLDALRVPGIRDAPMLRDILAKGVQ